MRPTVLCPVLIGRDHEVATLAGAISAAAAGRGAMVFVLGEAGIGKSRLVREGIALGRRRGLTVLRGRAVQGVTPLPYRPLIEAALAFLRTAPDFATSPPAELQPFLSALGKLVPDWREKGDVGLGDSDVILGEGVMHFLRAVGGCLLALEDLHWADPETLAVLEYMSDHLESEPIMVLATVRDEEPSSALSLAATIDARRSGLNLHLERMTHEDVQHMAQLCLGGSAVPPVVLELLASRADGLPLFVEELLADAISSSDLVLNEDRWEAQSPLRPVVPLTFADSVWRRLAALDDVAVSVVSAAAILGRYFDWTLLPAMTELSERTVLSVLRKAAEAQLIETSTHDPSAAFRFRHALTRDALLYRLLPPERATLARAALAALEAADLDLAGERCELAAQLAESAGDTGRAVELLLRAARRAMTKGALSTAEATLDRARDLARNQMALQASVDEVLIEVLTLAGKTDRVPAVGRELLTTLDSIGAPPESLGRAYLLLARAAVTANTWQLADEYLALARTHSIDRDDALIARLQGVAAQSAIGSHRPEEAEELAHGALDAATRAGLWDVACEALEVIGRCARLSRLDRADAAFQRALEIAEEHDLAVWRIRAMLELGTIDLLSGAPLNRLEAAHDVAARSGALVTACVIDLQIAAGRLLFGDTPGALTVVERACDAARRFRVWPLLGMSLTLEAEIHMLEGRFDAMERALSEAAQVGGDDPDVKAAILAERANRCLLMEDRAAAERYLDGAMNIVRCTPSISPHPVRGLWTLLQAIQDRDAESACTELEDSGATVQRVNAGRLHYARAVIHGRQGWPMEAEAAFAAGEAALAPMPWYRALTLRLVAEAAIEDGWGEPARWLREAIPVFEQHRHEHLLSACRSLLRLTGVPIPRRGRGESAVPAELQGRGVTSREMDVLLLLAQGLSNREIAARLYISHRTVERHVENLSGKLDRDSRSALVAFAASRLARQT